MRAGRGGPAVDAMSKIALPVLVPTLLAYTAQGAALPVLVLTGQRLGASAGLAALAVGILSLGQVLGALPAGALVARWSETSVLVGSTSLSGACWAACGLAPDLPVFFAAIWLSGVTSAAFGVARQAYVAAVVPSEARARALSTLGGAGRAGLFLGPLLGAVVEQAVGMRGAYVVAFGASMAAATTLALVARGSRTRPERTHPRRGVVIVARENLKPLLLLGSGVAVIAAGRAVRPVLLPLWSVHVGLSPSQLSMLFSAAAAVELLLFYPAGSVMDRFGRAWAAVPSAALLGLSMLLLPLAHSVLAVAAAAVVMGTGSGIGSGIVKVLGIDVAPPSARAEFLGIWTMVAECGSAGGPLLAGILVAAASVPVACAALGVPTLLTALWLGRQVPRFTGRA